MLHNSGPYGPNDNHIDMGPPVNIPPMSSPLDIGQNLSNLSKIAQQPPQLPSGQYNLPNYPTYGHPGFNLSPHIASFPNYNSIPLQGSYMSQNSSSIHDLSWQNGMVPMNLNTQENHSSNIVNYAHNIDKPSSNSMSTNDFMECNFRRQNTPLNIPQVPSKTLQRDSNHENYSMYNINQDKFNNFHQNLDLSTNTQEKPLLNNSKRKSLENTVRLIENILINTTKNKEMQRNQEKSQKGIKIDSVENIHKDHTNTEPKEETTQKPHNNSESEAENLTRKSINNQNNNNEKECSEDDTTECKLLSVEDPTPELITIKIELEEEEDPCDTNIDVKMEHVISWTDTEYKTPFLKDRNGVTREDAINSSIVDSENSVNEATAVVKSKKGDLNSNPNHYECPHCNLLFNHPKRFLIHTKWHTFGLTNEKRMEIIREREEKRNQRKEARVIDRMNAKEVKEVTSEDIVYPCKECDKIFSSKGSLKNHRARIHPRRMRACSICGISVLGWVALREHLAEHSSSGYNCQDCNKQFKYAHSLAKHRDTHLDKTISCSQCPKKFGTTSQLKMHQKVHERAERGTTYCCSHCPKSFYEAYNLAVHERTHKNERPYCCDICSSSFLTNSSLRRHLKVSHSTSKPFECATCHRCFISEAIRDRHSTRAHGDPAEFKFACTMCDCKYMKQKNLQKHINRLHPKGKKKKKDSDSE